MHSDDLPVHYKIWEEIYKSISRNITNDQISKNENYNVVLQISKSTLRLKSLQI